MYASLTNKLIGLFTFTGNTIIDFILIAVTAKVIHYIVFSFVGEMYAGGFISGSFWGKVSYLALWLLMVIPAVLLLKLFSIFYLLLA